MFRNSRRNAIVAVFLLAGAWILSADRAAGWGPGGHRVVANIAYDRLDAGTRSSIVKVLRQHEDFPMRFDNKMPDEIRTAGASDQERWIFLQAAIWPDLIRPIPQFHKESWHFANIPFFLSEVDQNALKDSIKPNLNFDVPSPLTATFEKHLNCVQAFKFCVRELTDSHTTDKEKAIYFCWLLHIAGDIHQPLHSTSLISRGRFNTSEGDRGGNDIKIKQGKNLHSFWDGLLGGNQTLNDIQGRAADILDSTEAKKAAETAAGNLKVEDWIKESNKIARDFVYTKAMLDEVAAKDADSTVSLAKIDLPLAYRQKAGAIAQQRVAEAGFRLAEVLKKTVE